MKVFEEIEMKDTQSKYIDDVVSETKKIIGFYEEVIEARGKEILTLLREREALEDRLSTALKTISEMINRLGTSFVD
jgi:hypothetical protein